MLMTVLLIWVLVSFAIALVLGRAIYQSDCTEQPATAPLPTNDAVIGAVAVERPPVAAAAAVV